MPSSSSSIIARLSKQGEWTPCGDFELILVDDHALAKAFTNVTGDGWCMLYAAQVAMWVDYGVYVSLNEMRFQLLQLLLEARADVDSAVGLPGPAPEELGKRIDIRKVAGTPREQRALVPALFLLFDFLEHKRFDSCVVDLVPHYLAQALGARVHIFSTEPFGRHDDHFSMTAMPMTSVGGVEHKRDIGLMLHGEHYLAASRLVPDIKDLEALSAQNKKETPWSLTDMISQLQPPPLFNDIAIHFARNSAIFHQPVSMRFVVHNPNAIIRLTKNKKPLRNFRDYVLLQEELGELNKVGGALKTPKLAPEERVYIERLVSRYYCTTTSDALAPLRRLGPKRMEEYDARIGFDRLPDLDFFREVERALIFDAIMRHLLTFCSLRAANGVLNLRLVHKDNSAKMTMMEFAIPPYGVLANRATRDFYFVVLPYKHPETKLSTYRPYSVAAQEYAELTKPMPPGEKLLSADEPTKRTEEDGFELVADRIDELVTTLKVLDHNRRQGRASEVGDEDDAVSTSSESRRRSRRIAVVATVIGMFTATLFILGLVILLS